MHVAVPHPARRHLLVAGLAAGSLLTIGLTSQAAASPAAHPHTTFEVYDSFGSGNHYTLADYEAKWANIYGLGEMAVKDTRTFTGNRFNVSAVPFQTSSDTSVFDHLKYLAVSTQTFPVPKVGSVKFGSTITARTPGTQRGRIVHGTYIRSGRPYRARLREPQQAAAVMNMIDFHTGQLFDWFVSGHKAFALIERLPSSVSGNTTDPTSPLYVGRDKMYTQIIRQVPAKPGPHRVAIRFSRNAAGGHADYYLDGRRVAHVDHVGIPLDRQGVHFTGTYPSLGPGEELGSQIDSVAIGHGLFSLVDAFPFQHPDAPGRAVTIPTDQRIFGQGVSAHFDDFTVRTVTR